MPIRRIFGFVFSIKETVRVTGRRNAAFFPERFVYHIRIRDHIWNFGYKPIAEASFWLSRKVGRLQHGRIQIYLLYSFLTLILLLVFA